MLPPSLMCDRHLLGEHVELHMLVGSLLKGRSIQGFLVRGLLEPQHVKERHAELVQEMVRRGMNHKSPLEEIQGPYGAVDRLASLKELYTRCARCKDIIDGTKERKNHGPK